MKIRVFVLIMVFTAGHVWAEMHSLSESQPQTRIRREASEYYTVEQQAVLRLQKLKPKLSTEAKNKLDRIARNLVGLLSSDAKSVDIPSFVHKEINGNFASISQKQSDLLSFYVLAETDRILKNSGILKNADDGVSEIGEMKAMNLQMLMDRRGKMIQTLRNIMEKISDTQDDIVQNIK